MTCSQSVSVNMSQFSQSIITCSLMSVLSGNSTSQVESATTTASAELHRWRPGTGSPAWALHTERILEFLDHFMVHNHAVAGYGSKVNSKGTFFGQPWVAKEGMEEKAQKESKSTRAQRAACAPARHWHCPTITQLTFFAPTTAKTVQSSSRERARPARVTYFPPRAWPKRVNATNSELLNRPGKGVAMLAGTLFHGLSAIQFAADRPEKTAWTKWKCQRKCCCRKAPSRGAAYSDKCRTDPGSGALSSRVPVRSGLRRYVAQDHDPWCPFVRDGATSAAGAWDQIIPQQMDPNASWEVLFLWKDF